MKLDDLGLTDKTLKYLKDYQNITDYFMKFRFTISKKKYQQLSQISMLCWPFIFVVRLSKLIILIGLNAFLTYSESELHEI